MTTTTSTNVCPTCSKPLAGRGKCKSYNHAAIGPRKVGTILEHRGYGRAEVLEVHLPENGLFSIVERDLTGQTAGRIRAHATAWDYRRYPLSSVRVVEEGR